MEKVLIVFPDPVTSLDMLSGAAFLYFDTPIILTIPPQLIKKESFELFKLVRSKKPKWGSTFFNMMHLWHQACAGSASVIELLTPLCKRNVKTVWPIYPATIDTLNECDQIVRQKQVSYKQLFPYIDHANACCEVLRHIMLEMFLHLNESLNLLYDYCDEFFTTYSIEEILVKGYLLRLNILRNKKHSSILLTNMHIWEMLFGGDNQLNAEYSSDYINNVISWEIFRRLVSPLLDPLDPKRINLIEWLLEHKRSQLDKMKDKCKDLANEVMYENTLSELVQNIEKVTRREIKSEIRDLLEIDNREVEELLTEIFTDYKTWSALYAFLLSLLAGQRSITTASAVGLIGSLSAKTVKVGVNRRKRLS